MANHKNEVNVKGNLTSDPDVKITKTGTTLLTFSIANNRSYKPKGGDEWQEETSFFDVTVWGDLAEDTAEIVEKGLEVNVVGRLKQDTWTTDDGSKRSKVNIVADDVLVSVRALQSITRKVRSGGAAPRQAPKSAPIPSEDPF